MVEELDKSDRITVTAEQAITVINDAMDMLENHKQHFVVGLFGPPGVGKTTIFQTVAKQRGLSGETSWRSMLMFPALKEAQDYGGFPAPGFDGNANEVMNLLPTAEMNEVIHAQQYILCINDEIDKSDTPVQNAVGQLIEARVVNNKPISDKVLFAFTGNGVEYNCGGRPLPDHIKSRIRMYHLEADAISWIKWAINNNIDPVVVAFIDMRPELLFNYNSEIARDLVSYACPRTWEKLSQALQAGMLVDNLDEDNEALRSTAMATTTAIVGQAAATEFLCYLELRAKMPHPAQILLNPKDTEVPQDVHVLYALCAALVSRARKDNIGRICDYVQRMPEEYAVMFMRIVTRQKPAVEVSSAFTKFRTQYVDIM